MGCSSQKGVQTKEEGQKPEEDNLQMSLKNENNEKNIEENIGQNQEEKLGENDNEDINQNQEEKIEYNLEQKEEEIKIKDEPITQNKKDELGGAPPESNDLFNSKVNKSSSIKSYNRKSINKKRKKKPFIISVVEDSTFKKIQIIINACSFLEEYTMPIWCPKDAYIKFKVKGEWRIDKLYQQIIQEDLAMEL